MKRHFSFGFKALAACAMSAMLAVSCYDDSKLWEEIEGLEERVAALEEKLNTEVATLNSKIGAVETALKTVNAEALAALTEELDALDGTVDGYIKSNDAALKAAIDELKKADAALADVDTDVLLSLAKLGVVSVEKDKDGKVVITFVDESTLEIANEAGVVTIVDGKWAVVVDGEVTVLDALVHPDTTLDFRVGDDNTLYVSYDGKKTWESTGVVVNDETTFNVVSGYEYNEEEGYLSLTIGGEEYQLPIYQPDNSELTFGRSDIYFAYGVSKNVELNNEDIEEFYVMSKPDGWKVALEGTTLTVTAPSQELVELGAGEASGKVLVHATSVTGSCKVAALDVTTGPKLTMTYENGNINVFSAFTYTIEEYDYTYTDFYALQFGISKANEYKDYKTIGEFVSANKYDALYPIQYYHQYVCDGGECYYIEGEREEFKASIPLAAILEDDNIELESDETYVFWIVPTDDYGHALYEEALYVVDGHVVSFESTNPTYNNVDILVDYFGADGVYVGATSKTYLKDEMYYGMDYTDVELFQSYLETGLSLRWGATGPFVDFIGGDDTAMGNLHLVGDQFGLSLDLKLSDIVLPNHMGKCEVAPDSEYFVWILPYYEDKALEDYDMTDVIMFTSMQTSSMEHDSNVVADFSYVATPNEAAYVLTSPVGGTTYHTYMPYDDYVDYLSDYSNEELASYVVNDCLNPISGERSVSLLSYEVEPGKRYAVLTYSVCGEKYGDAKVFDFTIPTLTDYFATLSEGATFKFKDYTWLELTEPIVVTKDLTIDLNDAELSSESSDIFEVRSGTLTIKGDGLVTAGSGDAYVAVWANGGNVVINGGTYAVGADANGNTNDCVYAKGGTITINGGTFSNEGTYVPSNGGVVVNANNTVANSKVVINGGTFTPADGCVAYEQKDVDAGRIILPTPVGKQWISEDTTLATSMFMMPTTTLFDLGVFAPDPSVPSNTFTFSVDYGTMMGNPDPIWVFVSYYGTYSVEPEDATSGVLVIDMMMQGSTMNIPYSNLDADSVTFDFTSLGMGEMNFTRPAEQVEVLLTPPTSGDDL